MPSLLAILAIVMAIFTQAMSTPTAQHPLAIPNDDQDLLAYQRVNVTLGVMAKCPDALACEAVFDKVLDRVNSKVRLTMSYIGTVDKHKHQHKYGVECKHGDQECAANIQQLCVQHALDPQRAGDDYDLSPSAAQKKWWNFIQCQNYAGLSKIGDEDQARKCLNLVGGPRWEQDGIAACVHSSQGRKLLKRSVTASHNSNISLSCTIQIEGTNRCIRDGSAWKNCQAGHEVGDFVSQIEKEWSRKNGESLQPASVRPSATLRKRQSSPSPSAPDGNGILGSGSRTPPSVFTLVIGQYSYTLCLAFCPSQNGDPITFGALNKRQNNGGNPFQGPNLPIPFLAFAVTAIALFVVVVCFVLLRIIVRNRRLRRLGLLPDGPFDRFLGPTREIEDTLVPPKLLEARITHDYRPDVYQADIKRHGWDAVMPISAALPPNLYADLFAAELKAKEKANNGNEFSYPPPSSPNRTMRMQLPSFMRRTETGDEATNPDGTAAEASRDDADVSAADQSAPASVNVTVLIAMPSPSTVFPTAQTLRRNQAPSQSLKRVASQKLEEVNEHADEDARSLRRTASIKSFRTAASVKSLGEARREVFFHNLAHDEEQPNALPTNEDDDIVSHHHADFDDEEELPELVFGTASVPIFSRGSATAPVVNRQAFPGTSEAFHPLRLELMNLVRSGHEARQRKERNDEAAKQAEKEAAIGDDGQTTLDERSTRAPLTSAGGPAIRSPVVDTHRLSTADTIDSDAGAAIGSSTRQDGLGDVVGRMMMPAPAPPAHFPEPERYVPSADPTATSTPAPLNRDPLLGNTPRPYTTT